MRTLSYANAIDDALGQAMAEDERVVVWGEDVELLRRNLLVRFGPGRVRSTPISESAFIGAGVSAAMAGLRPVVELMMVDFAAVAMDALLNHAAKIEAFSGGRWRVPMVLRAPCGAGYGDGGQHGQSLWGWLAHIPGLTVVVPSTPADAGGLLLAAIQHPGPVVFMEHKLLSDDWRDFLGACGRDTLSFDVPKAGAAGKVPDEWQALELGRAAVRREGKDVTLLSLGVSLHRCLEAAERLATRGISATVVDLVSVAPLDRETIAKSVKKSGRVVVVDEDFREFGLSGEIAATLAEAGIPCRFARVCTEVTTPYARAREDAALPNVSRIVAAVDGVMAEA